MVYHHFSDESQIYNLKPDLLSELWTYIANSLLNISIWMSYQFLNFNWYEKELDIPSTLFLPKPLKKISNSIFLDLVV